MPLAATDSSAIRRVVIVSDAWLPQVNGVVRTLSAVARELRASGRDALVMGPDRFRTIPCPTYPDIRLALLPQRRLVREIKTFRPDALHIATEGPLGMAARRWAMQARLAFTSSFHTKFPEYIRARIGVPVEPVYAWLRRFHEAAQGTMVAAPSLRAELAAQGFRRILPWSRGVDTDLFRPEPRRDWGLPRPLFLYVGRVAVEKNIRAFLDLDLPGSKAVVGDGPQFARLIREYPDVRFTGPLHGPALAQAYAGADVMVFPSRTDTFGLVLLESLACGTPIAAFPVTGPNDVLAEANAPVGAVNADLRCAALAALDANRAACRSFAERFSWRACAQQFLSNLSPIGAG